MTPADELALEARASGARDVYRFRTADGVHSKDEFRDAELLLVEALWGRPLGHLLCVEANYGVVGTVLADAADAVTMTESSARAANLCERNARANDVEATVSVVADHAILDGTFDAAAYAPQPYAPLAVGRQQIADALATLRPGGTLFLAAAPRTGLARYRECLDGIASDVERIGERDGHRLLRATRPAEFDPPTFVEPRTLRPTVDGVDLSLRSVPGLFAASGLDDGTRLLLETATLGPDDRVLDLCCGYGAVGCYAATVAEDAWLTDDDRVATACAECSLRASGVDATVVTGDCVAGVADRTFDRVLCNPPTHAGRGVLSDLFAGARAILAPGGTLAVVHHRDLDLSEHLPDAETIRAGSEHVVVRTGE